MLTLHAFASICDLKNNIVLPLMDYLFGTLYLEPEPAPLSDSQMPMTRMQHQIDIAGEPVAVLRYAASVNHWPEWHPSSLKIDGPQGPLHAGARFEEDIHAGGRAGHLRWEVTEYLPGRRWCARARGDHPPFASSAASRPAASVSSWTEQPLAISASASASGVA